jgi:hypothetical protein
LKTFVAETGLSDPPIRDDNHPSEARCGAVPC